MNIVTQSTLQYAHNKGHTDVRFFEDGSKFITCGSDGDVRIWSNNYSEDPVNICVGESAYSVVAANSHIYVSTSNNDIQILDKHSGHKDGILTRCVAPINQLAINRNGDRIALAGEDTKVRVIDLDVNGGNKSLVELIGAKGPCISVALSKDHVAASYGDGVLRIWNIAAKQVIKEYFCCPKINSFENVKSLCRMDFNPSDTLLAYPHHEKVIILDAKNLWKNKYSFDGPGCSFSIVQFSSSGKYLAAASTDGHFVLWNVLNGTILSTTVHEKHLSICGLCWKPESDDTFIFTDVEGQLGTITGCTTRESNTTSEGNNGECVDDFHFEESDKENENISSSDARENVDWNFDDIENQRNLSGSSVTSEPTRVACQPVFMPSSTPGDSDCYLCWNHVGVIRLCAGEVSEFTTIEVEFLDKTFHKPLIISNTQKFHLGHLSQTVVALANKFLMKVIPVSYTSDAWTMEVNCEENIELGEKIVLIGASDELVCIVTNKYWVRIFSLSGVPMSMHGVSGPPITISCYANNILIAYHAYPVVDGGQCIGFQMISFKTLVGKFTMMPNKITNFGVKLKWLGFSDNSSPCAIYSDGIMEINHNLRGWIPYSLGVEVGTSDGFFATAVFEKRNVVVGVICLGGQFPALQPHPELHELQLHALMEKQGCERSALEMNLLKLGQDDDPDMERQLIENGLKLFALNCKSGFEDRAVELVELLNIGKLTELAIRYASSLNKPHLTERLIRIVRTDGTEGYDSEQETASHFPSYEQIAH